VIWNVGWRRWHSSMGILEHALSPSSRMGIVRCWPELLIPSIYFNRALHSLWRSEAFFHISGWFHHLLYIWMFCFKYQKIAAGGVFWWLFVSRLTHDEYEHDNDSIMSSWFPFVLKIERITLTSLIPLIRMRVPRHLSHNDGETCHPCTNASILHSHHWGRGFGRSLPLIVWLTIENCLLQPYAHERKCRFSLEDTSRGLYCEEYKGGASPSSKPCQRWTSTSARYGRTLSYWAIGCRGCCY
jgi:hypothetical protein